MLFPSCSLFCAIGQSKALHKVKYADEQMKSQSSPELGFFKDPSAHQLVDRARILKFASSLRERERDH